MEIVKYFIFPASLASIMYGMGLSLNLQDFQRVLTRRYPVTVGVISMLFFVPLLGIILALRLSPSPALAVGIVLLATCPGGMVSNLMTDLADGDLALSVSMTIVVSIIYVLLIPFIANAVVYYFMGSNWDIKLPLLLSFIKLFGITLFPIAMGMVTRHLWPSFSEKTKGIVKQFAMLFLIIAFTLIVIDQWEIISQNFSSLFLIVVTLNVLSISLAFTIAKLAKLNHKETIAVCVEHSIRQEGTAIFIAITLLNNYEMSIPMILNTPIGMVVCVSFVLWFRYIKPRDT